MGAAMPIFVCECCTVRAHVDRELRKTVEDAALMAFERMRIIDMAHNWAPKTTSNYAGKLRTIQRFETRYRTVVLRRPRLLTPPISEAIPLMWAEQECSLQLRRRERFAELPPNDNGRVGYDTVRHYRSAAAHHHTWCNLVLHPGKIVLDGNHRPIQVNGCRATDDYTCTLMHSGMSRRLGTKPRQSAPLLDRHVRWIDQKLEVLYLDGKSAHDKNLCHELANAGVLNLLLWLGWLRSSEAMGMEWADIEMFLPRHAAGLDLPQGVGAILFTLLEQTKSSQSQRADLMVAFQSFSGLGLGKWLLRLRGELTTGPLDPSAWKGDERPLFLHHDGKPWTAAHYRHTYLLSFIQQQKLEGDKYLQQFVNLQDAFWSLHSYRSGARSHVSIKREGCWRKASTEEVNEHGRWRVKKSNESMAERYRQWTHRDRLSLTYLCM